MVPLGEVSEPVARPITPEPTEYYRFIGVKWWGEGAYEFVRKLGAETAALDLNRVEQDDIVINKIWARHGSIALIPAELHGAVGSSEFPTFRANPSRLLPRWIYWWSKTKSAWDACSSASFGSSGKNRIKPAEFLRIPIPLPNLEDQQRIIGRLDAVEAQLAKRQVGAEAVENELAALLEASFHRITSGAPRMRMRDVAPLVRRPAAIELGCSYPELGIRSFGKGTFHKPPLAGVDVGSKKLFEVHAGDLVFSNVFAWEGAVAVAKRDDHGRFGSHRFISRVPDPRLAMASFLCFWFLTPDGLQELGRASPGGAGRNRTLGLEALDEIEVPVPSISAQQWFNALQQKAFAAREAQAAASSDLDQLMPALLAEAFGDG